MDGNPAVAVEFDVAELLPRCPLCDCELEESNAGATGNFDPILKCSECGYKEDH